MACEDTAKLRTPLKSVCQTPDIGCVPITNGKPACNPQPDEIPVAFDPSTTTLWLFSCKTREWVAFQKFSMCQLSSINLDNIQNICDILQIGVSYNPGTGCKQGTISLKELGEKILECVQLQTRAVSVTANGDKLKIWVEGLEPLPPFYVEGRNLWSEGGTGTEVDPLKIATYDPICEWPTKSQAQVDDANVKHIGACIDGQMSRVPFPPKVCELPEKSQAQVNAAANKQMIACINGEGAKVPYPKMPCEFPQMTVEQVNAAADKDMIVCVDGENTKVPIHDQLLTPICDNPQISVSQAKAKPKLRIVSCEDGNIMLFPLPPEMFQGHYMCVPFIDGIPSGPPAEGSGPIRFDCNDDIWFWVCEENRWHRIDVGNHYHPPWKEVYDFIANRCENIKFHGWSEQGECYTDFEITPKELADFILCECLDSITPTEVNDAIARGEEAKHHICVNGSPKKIDWSICSRPTRDAETLNSDIEDNKEPWVSVCVDGKNYKTNWNTCSWPEIPSLDLLNISENDIKFNVCANGGNKTVKLADIMNYYNGVEIYTASRGRSGFKHFHYTGLGNVAVIRSRDGSFVKGQVGTNMVNTPPFGKTSLRLTNNSDFLKLYIIIHGIRLQRPFGRASEANVAAYCSLSYDPPYCNLTTRASDYLSQHGYSGEPLVGTCEEQRAKIESDPIVHGIISGHPTIVGTDDFDISTHPFGWTANLSVATLSKDDVPMRLEPWRGIAGHANGGWAQMSNSLQATSIYVLPGEEVTISQEVLFSLRDISSTGEVLFLHGQHMIVLGLSASITKNDSQGGDSDNDGAGDGDDND